MARVVVKLGSSIVADEAGEPRIDVLASLCDEAAERHRAGAEIVIVTGMPAAVAISAATTFERMPPEPSGERDIPMS